MKERHDPPPKTQPTTPDPILCPTCGSLNNDRTTHQAPHTDDQPAATLCGFCNAPLATS